MKKSILGAEPLFVISLAHHHNKSTKIQAHKAYFATN